MPRMTGLELAQAVHRLRPGLPVVLITGYADGIDADRLGQFGVSVMKKPVDPAALYARLAEVLRPVAAPGKP